MFSPSFFDQLEDRLNLAVFDINESHRMGLREIKQALRGHPKRPEVHLAGNPKGYSLLTLPGQEIEISPKDTAQQIRAKLNPEALARVDAAVSAITDYTPVTFMTEPQEKPSMSITGAANLAGTIKDRINAAKARIAQVSANTDGALAKLNDAADTGDKIATQIEAEASDLLAQIGQFSNGGPE